MKAKSSVFEKEVLLDIAVNIIPLAVIVVFAAVFLVVNPWANDTTFSRVLQYALLVLPFIGLSILTYAAARRIEVEEDIEVGP
ncbi:DUF6684 family protein [Halarchaeum nitratireducens]|uniref:Cox cluster protein n=1 Tax=Halarchaeum nitratireducens TaxID=489913 RepID=A0A830GC48_9EURY|nr:MULTISPECIES: DUF6684 family protein [Halarchaeum]MBP2250846.1 hypothetical protein [Halarchaeum solikamskense]GGN19384.1 hypothetical protein GCM10009021_20570 [Halarchaeum nitratireducens]